MVRRPGRRLRARTETADVPILVLSADSTSRNVTRLLETGADAYLTKPLDVPQFLDVVDRLLAHSLAPDAVEHET